MQRLCSVVDDKQAITDTSYKFHCARLICPTDAVHHPPMQLAHGDGLLSGFRLICASSFSPVAASDMSPFCSAAGHAYAAVISACAAGGAWQRAVQLFDQMLQYQIKPDVVSCTALITALGADGQWKRGSQVVDWMLRSGVKPNVRTYTALITAMGNAQKWDLALDLIKRMKTPQAWGTVEPNAYTYSALLKTMGEQVYIATCVNQCMCC